MALLDKKLKVKKSNIPGAGKGLFTTVDIKKGTRIIEYKGKIVTWKEVENMPEERNGYVFYFNKKYCLDAWKTKKSIAGFANDAKGLVRVEGLKNNTEYVTKKKRCFVEAKRKIPKGSEILVGYGSEYWKAIKYNVKLEEEKNGKAVLPHTKEQKARKKNKKK